MRIILWEVPFMPPDSNVPLVKTAVTTPDVQVEDSQALPVQKEARSDNLADPLVDTLSDPLKVQFSAPPESIEEGSGDAPSDGPGDRGPVQADEDGGAPPAGPGDAAPGGSSPGAGDPNPDGSPIRIQAKASSSMATPDAEQAVRGAPSAGGEPLPPGIRAKFESSLGADLRAVRLHSGPDSEEAADAIGALAFTEGQDIHFAAGEFDPDAEEGERLLAHEVAHTAQEGGNVQAKLEVSSPGDPAEVQADAAADAMVEGRPAQVSAHHGTSRQIRRTPEGETVDGMLWASGEEVLRADADALASKVAMTMGVATKLIKYGGLDLTGVGDKMAENAKIAIESDIEAREGEINHHEEQIEVLEDLEERNERQEEMLRYYKGRLPRLEQELETIEDNKDGAFDTIEQKCAQAGQQIASYGITVSNIGMLLTSKSATVTPALFQDLGTGLDKLDKACKIVDFAIEYCEQGELNAFKTNPSYETAQAWALKVGDVFDKASGLVGGLPPGWDTVISGALKVPKTVITGFISVQKAYLARVEAALHPPGTTESKLLDEGTSG